MLQLWPIIIRNVMIPSCSYPCWHHCLRISSTTSRRLSSSSGPTAVGARLVPCESADASSDKELEEDATVSSASPGSKSEWTHLGKSGRKVLLTTAMGLNSTSKSSENSAVDTPELKVLDTKSSRKKMLKQVLEESSEFSSGLHVVMGVARDDEAARMIPSLSIGQKMRVLSTLTTKRRRSVPLLRALAASVTASSQPLDLKAAADVLYAAATLNFPDGPLLEKATTDASSALAAGEEALKSRLAVIRSIAVSLGLLRYRDVEVLEQLSAWLVSQLNSCRTQEVAAVLLTLATVNYLPSNIEKLFQAVLPRLKEQDFHSASAWLDSIWALAVLGQLLPELAASVLNPEFISRLARTAENADSANVLSVGSKLKLLNVNAVAQYLIPNYKGPLLQASSEVSAVPLGRPKEKQILVNAVADALSNLLPSSSYLHTDVNTGMGFMLDAECLIDSKCNPVPFPDTKLSAQRGSDRKIIKVAVSVWGYQDVCRGRGSPPPLCGPAALAEKLLFAKGYRVLRVHHAEFGDAGSGLVRRVQFLERRLKQLATTTVGQV